MLGQSRSTLDLAEVMDHGGIQLVNLSKGALGEESTRPGNWRPDFNLYLDEFQNYLHLPQSLDDVLAESRAYRLSLTLANQHLGQLREAARQAVQATLEPKSSSS